MRSTQPTVDEVAEHNKEMWERLAKAAMNYTRPFGRPPKTRAGMRRFMDPRGRLKGVRLADRRAPPPARGGGAGGRAVPPPGGRPARRAPPHAPPRSDPRPSAPPPS